MIKGLNRNVLVFVCAATALAQSDRGTITGAISDPAGGVIASAPIEAKNTDTGATYTYKFTKQKTLTIGAESDSPGGNSGAVNNAFNRQVNKDLSAYDQLMVSAIALNYSTPKWAGVSLYLMS